ncbi:hypothetical protein ALC57_09658 [Trachymyrmex cornetzi]|uniref:Uncharacterized protein n=1 Tax=Trachymyrmex cornetzi TaxID=471704 RepID=A0A195DYR4_9HYME|nr:hypothetical protein ALC57_09658 [Trachymyrmex cornetzi]
MMHYIGECREIKDRFKSLGRGNKEILKRLQDESLDEEKGELLRKLWKEREEVKKGGK